MSEYAQQATATASGIVAEIPSRIARLQELISTKFSMSLDEANTQFETAVFQKVAQEDPTDTGVNQCVMELNSIVRRELAELLDAFRCLESWLQLSVPQISDGNNFGVEVLEHICKRIGEEKKTAKAIFDSLKSYSTERAAAWEKAVFSFTVSER
jgi:hypothetical protein